MHKTKKRKKDHKQSKTLRISIPENQWQAKEELTNLGKILGCSVTTLVWYSIELMLHDPPITALKPVTKTTRGFWVTIKLSIFREIVGIEVKEVLERTSVKAGRHFFGYKGGKDQTYNRTNAQEKAIMEADRLAAYLDQPVTTTFLNDE